MAAANVDVAYMKAHFPILNITTPGAEDVFINDMIAWAVECVDEDIWGDKCTQGIATLAAHFIQLNRSVDNGGTGGGTGAITTEKVGDLQRSFAQPASSSPSDDMALSETSFGRMYQSLRKRLSRSPLVI